MNKKDNVDNKKFKISKNIVSGFNEISKALVDGVTLTDNKNYFHRMIDIQSAIIETTNIFGEKMNNEDLTSIFFSKTYYICEEPKWYENIPDGGLLCMIKESSIYVIDWYDDVKKTLHSFDGISHYSFATSIARPLSEKEWNVFVKNLQSLDL